MFTEIAADYLMWYNN